MFGRNAILDLQWAELPFITAVEIDKDMTIDVPRRRRSTYDQHRPIFLPIEWLQIHSPSAPLLSPTPPPVHSMDSTISSSASLSIPKFRCFDPTYAYSPTAANHRRSFTNFSPTFKSSSIVNMVDSDNSERKIVTGDAGYVLEDVPHLSDYIPDLPVSSDFSNVSLKSVWLPRK
ncbi:hypothetical protein LWI28_022517 [Acer negundo]|uniref:Uncharacterized protein n=1 Tax=Acer negundo TaxID=4023 RepID=A0AAD5IGN6_ACENE|nr:hypothetical protein LWI28_022517 [Acer negundo]